MYSTLLQIYMKKRLSPNQYGGRPNVSALDAWIDLLRNGTHHPDMYEYDIKSFFNNVPVRMVNNYMHKEGVPEEIIK